MLVQLEQECLEAYKRRVDQASHDRNLLRQAVAESRAELALICSAIGERMTPIKKVLYEIQSSLFLYDVFLVL